jgi:hypothetical protein
MRTFSTRIRVFVARVDQPFHQHFTQMFINIMINTAKLELDAILLVKLIGTFCAK